ncbi:MAG: guanylate kinase, partial [Myxococcota bacterium]
MSLNLTRFARPDRGALFVVTGASGTGKTTLVKEALATVPDLGFSVSATTRAPRVGEVDGRDYHFVSQERYTELVEAGAFLEWAEVDGNCY